eukprot:81726_1
MSTLYLITASLLIAPFKPDQTIDCSNQNTCSCDANLDPQEKCILNCNSSDSACQNTQLQCHNNSICNVICEGTNACDGATLISNGATDVYLQCWSNKIDNTCGNTVLQCGAGSCSLDCAGPSENTVCDGVQIETIQDTTDFQCVSVCPTSAQTMEFTSNPSSSPSQPSMTPTRHPTVPTLTPTTADPSTNPTNNPTLSPNIDEEPSTSSANQNDDAKDENGEFEFDFLSTEMFILAGGVCCMCCCLIGYALYFRQQRKKKQMIEAFSTTFGSKSKSDKEEKSKSKSVNDDPLPSTAVEVTEDVQNVDVITTNVVQVEENRKGANTLSVEQVDQETKPPLGNAFLNPRDVIPLTRQTTQQFEKEMKSVVQGNQNLLNDIVSDMDDVDDDFDDDNLVIVNMTDPTPD